MTFQFSRPSAEPSGEKWTSPLAGWSAYRDLEVDRKIGTLYSQSPAAIGEVAGVATVELPDNITAMQQPLPGVAEYLLGPEPQS